MKYTNLKAFEKHLESSAPKHFLPVYSVLSKESFEKKMVIDKMLSHLAKNDLAQRTLEGESLDIATLMDELNTNSLFSESRVVIIQNVDKCKKTVVAVLEKYVEHPAKHTTLILTATTLPANTNFYKRLEKVGVIFDTGQEKPWEKEKWLIEWISSSRKMSHETCQYLLKHVGTDQGILQQEIDKLSCYAGEREEITIQDIRTLCSGTNTETIWQLGEAIFKRDAASALRICKALLNEGTVFFALLKQLRNQLQTEYQVCSILSQGGGGPEVAQQFPYMKGSILERHMSMAQQYGMQRFRKGLLLIDETDTQAKNTNADTDLLAELLMVKLTL